MILCASLGTFFVIAERQRTCELTAELFAITYTRYWSAQISLRFVYRGMLPGGDTFVRYLGLFLYFTEWYFEPVGRIPLHLKLSRKIPSRNVFICRSSVSSLARLSTLSKHIPQFFDLSREQRSVSGRGSSFPLYSRTIKTHPEIQAEPQSRKNILYTI